MCFFFNLDLGTEMLLTTDPLSRRMMAGPSTLIPIIRSLYPKACTFSLASLAAMISDLKVAASTVFSL